MSVMFNKCNRYLIPKMAVSRPLHFCVSTRIYLDVSSSFVESATQNATAQSQKIVFIKYVINLQMPQDGRCLGRVLKQLCKNYYRNQPIVKISYSCKKYTCKAFELA